MNSETYSLENLLEITSSKRIYMSDYTSSGIPFYRGKEVIELAKGNNVSTELFITSEKYQKIEQQFGSPKDGDILLTSIGTLGVAYFVVGDDNFYFKDANVTWFRNFKPKVVSKFLYYWLMSPVTQKKLDEISIGSSQQALTISALKKLKVELPSINEQKSIVDILDALSDRITLLRETNKTIEAIAQALFKSLFVDFDPVHTKSDGRKPEGMDEATAALFPDSFEESELGLVPTGWAVQTVGELIVLKRGTSITKSKCIEGDIPVVAAGLEPSYFHNQNNVSSPVVTISSSGTNAGFVRLYQEDIWASDCLFVSTEQTDTIYFWYVFLKSSQEKIYFMQQGAVQPHVYLSDLMRLRICTPKTDELRSIFNRLVLPLFERIGVANEKIFTLTNLRDTLLPRLISGQLRITNTEETVEKATI